MKSNKVETQVGLNIGSLNQQEERAISLETLHEIIKTILTSNVEQETIRAALMVAGKVAEKVAVAGPVNISKSIFSTGE